MVNKYGRRKINVNETQSHQVNGTNITLKPFKPTKRLHKVTTNMDLKDAIQFALNTREFIPFILRRVANCGAPFFYVIRELSDGENLDHIKNDSRNSYWSINQ